MNIIRYILSQPELTQKPPVLFDIGASGELHAKWKKIAPFSICVAFDADDREFSFAEKKSAHYKKLFVINRIVTDRETDKIDFYLTRFPYCSSSLEPDQQSLEKWAFGDKFIVDRKVQLPSVTIGKILEKEGIDRIDWFKTDTQGTDLRLYLSLPAPVKNAVLAAEFEPGIMDGYRNEDKLYDVLQVMRNEGYFISDMEVKGTQRLAASTLGSYSGTNKMAVGRAHKKSPGWAEVTCLRELDKLPADRRAYMLLYVFACLENQHGYALSIAEAGLEQWNDSVFSEMKKAAGKSIGSLKYRLPLVVFKKQLNRLLRGIHV